MVLYGFKNHNTVKQLEQESGNFIIDKKPFFSVVIPTYNRAHAIQKSIESILIQTFRDFEIIVADDASTDNTEEVVCSMQDGRIHYFMNEKNLERCLTRNKGIEAAKGEYICFLDSDDYHLPNHLQVIYDKIQEENKVKGFYFTNAWNEDMSGNRTERCCPDFENENSYTYFLRYTVNPQRWAVHHTVFEKIKFDNDVIICEDMDTSLRMLAAGIPVFQVKTRSTVYVAAPDSFTVGDANKASKELFYLKRIFLKKELKGKLPGTERRRLLSMCYFHLAVKAYEEKKRLQVLICSLKSFFLFPRGYNGKTNKILAVICLYTMPVIGNFSKYTRKR